ncbi:MAG TPA: SusD/RagB family nutrient-binding outer membrane lipoprotein [Chitinophagaceae bacterium]|nr:SusD/RagB family nutrient-binding outer membrane lipoprotein [Chitinophagaceae bacterium]
MKKLISYTLLLAAVVTIASCKKYLDINDNPNAPTNPTINGLLGRVTEETSINVYRAGDITGNYVQYLASTGVASPFDIYEPIDASELWTHLYDVMTDIYDLDKIGEEKTAPHHQGVARILMAINLKMVHDLWGDAPFTEAFSNEVLTPAYDDAQANYQKCMTLLDEGITLLQQPNPLIELSSDLDFIHHGNTAAWIKTAHALKARWLNLLSKKPEYNADNILAELNAAYTSNTDDAEVTEFDIRNPWADVAVNNADLILGGWLSDNIVKAMNGVTYGVFDPRLPLITNLTKFGDYRGTRNGAGRGTSSGTENEESFLTTDGWYSSTNSPMIIISYAECKFIEAEAFFRKGQKPEAYNAYLEGIKANMNKMEVAPASRDAYIDHASVSVGAANITLALIMKEKYIALFLSPETWNDARRYDYQYQGFQMPLNAVTSTFIRRFVYPDVELSRNGANVPTVTDVTQKLWWDQ